jgi:hypothetical protein
MDRVPVHSPGFILTFWIPFGWTYVRCVEIRDSINRIPYLLLFHRTSPATIIDNDDDHDDGLVQVLSKDGTFPWYSDDGHVDCCAATTTIGILDQYDDDDDSIIIIIIRVDHDDEYVCNRTRLLLPSNDNDDDSITSIPSSTTYGLVQYVQYELESEFQQ